MPRQGRSISGIGYSVHGAGCRLTDEHDRIFDVDMVRDSATGKHVEAFDAWRICWFLDQDGASLPSIGELQAACRTLAHEGELREVPGHHGHWFTLPVR